MIPPVPIPIPIAAFMIPRHVLSQVADPGTDMSRGHGQPFKEGFEGDCEGGWASESRRKRLDCLEGRETS